MKTFLILAALLIVSNSLYAKSTRKDPNLNKTSSHATTIAPGCTEFIHPCSGQASTALLNAVTTPTSKTATSPQSTTKEAKIK